MTSHPTQPNARPARRRSLFTRFVAIALLCLFTPIFVFGATVAATGTVTVRVQDSGPDGVNLWIPVPAILLDVALFAAPSLIPMDELDEVRREAAPFLPGLRSLAHDLESIPAGSVLVQVQDRGETVMITKEWRSFEIKVDTHDTKVEVSVPARLLSRSLSIFG